MIDALETGGFVERRRDPHERRMRRVVPTDKGHALLTTARTAFRDVEARLMRDLSSAEQVQPRQLLARVAQGAGHRVLLTPQDSATRHRCTCIR